jgi:Phage terminase, small subunit
MAELTEKQKKFADEYLIDLNATQAAARAGYKDPNFGRQLLTKTNVSEYIQKRQKDIQVKTEITQERVLAELVKIGFANITDFLDYETVKRIVEYKNGEPVIDWTMIVNAKNSSEVDGSAIQEVSASRDGTFKFKLYSKLDALEKITKILGFDKPNETKQSDQREDDNLWNAVAEAVGKNGI